MTLEILLVLLLLSGAVAVFATGVLRMDIAALLLLAAVAVLGLTTPERALAGFASPAVIAIGSMYVLSAGLSRTGVADWVGARILAWAGGGETRLIVAVTLFSGVLSGFMNNMGVAAMMLPVTVKLARMSEIPPSKLLIPMALGAQLGGFTTLIGTSPNLVASEALREAGFAPFALFGFTPLGVVLLGAGSLFVAVAAPRLLPARTPDAFPRLRRPGLMESLELEERFLTLTLPRRSLLDGKTLGESLIGSALGVHVLAVERNGEFLHAPGSDTVLRAGDRLLVQGRPDFFLELRGRRHLAPRGDRVPLEWLETEEAGLAVGRVGEGSPLSDHSVSELDFRAEKGVLVLSVLRGGEAHRTHLRDTVVRPGDELLLQGPPDRLEILAAEGGLERIERIAPEDAVRRFELAERLWSLRITSNSLLAGRLLGETRLGDAVGLMVLAIGRDDGAVLLPGPETELCPGDHLLVKSRPEDLAVLRGLQRLRIDLDPPVTPTDLESSTAGFVEAVLAPRSRLQGQTLRDTNFRGRFGLHVVAIIREGETVRANLRDQVLRFGDALLLYGPRRKARALAREPDLILLQEPEAAPPDVRLAPRSLLVVVVALLPIVGGLLPVAVALLAGAVLMVVTGCLARDEAYRAVDWSVLILVAGMLGLAAALQDTGAASLAGEGIMAAGATLGPWGVLALLTVATALAAQIIPGPGVVVIVAPVALAAAQQLGVSPYPLVMAVAIASTSLASPVSQPAQALVMAPAGYRLADYLRLGVPMTVLVLLLTILITPLIFPF